MNLGQTIKRIRKEKNVSQSVLAKQCEISQTYLSKIENDKKEPTILVLKNISSNLDIPLPILFFLAVDEDDVKEERKTQFNEFAPVVKGIVDKIFMSDNI